MMRLLPLRERVRVEIICADLPQLLSRLSRSGISLRAVEYTDELKAILSTDKVFLNPLRTIASGRGAQVTVLEERGGRRVLGHLFHRPLILAGLLFFLLFSCFVPTRIFFVQVTGNEMLPDNLILEKAARCGIGFGASRREVRSEKIKNALLQELPQLQWAGVNSKGCVATISVSERTEPAEEETVHAASSIVAISDGIIESITVTRGNLKCKVGQAVEEGQVLVSAYTDCGLSVTVTAAEAEIYAKTRRIQHSILPEYYLAPGENIEQISRYALVFGKKRINLYKGSSILEGSCVRIYDEKRWALPGGLTLPVTLVKETWVYRSCQEACFSDEQAERTLSAWTEDYVLSSMTAGSILSRTETYQKDAAVYHLDGEYACSELIGSRLKEEIFDYDDKDN